MERQARRSDMGKCDLRLRIYSDPDTMRVVSADLQLTVDRDDVYPIFSSGVYSSVH